MRNCCILLLLLVTAVAAPPAASESRPADGDGWVVMPAGARPAFFGIHGGTMPVSLLVYGDGSSLVAFVGRTGNDFMEVLRRSDTAMPSLFRPVSRRTGRTGTPSANATAVLMAGTGADSLPVFNLSGEGFSRMAEPGELQPFGLSDKPLSIEGEVTRPPRLAPVRQYRLLFQPHYLQPRRSRR